MQCFQLIHSSVISALTYQILQMSVVIGHRTFKLNRSCLWVIYDAYTITKYPVSGAVIEGRQYPLRRIMCNKGDFGTFVVGAAQRWVWNILSQIIRLQINNLGSRKDVLLSNSAAKGVIRLDRIDLIYTDFKKAFDSDS